MSSFNESERREKTASERNHSEVGKETSGQRPDSLRGDDLR